MPCDTLEFYHVSYQRAAYPVTGPVDDVVIVLHEQELPPAIFIGGDTKEKYLLKPGTGLLKSVGIITTSMRSGHPSGREIGSVAQTKKPFLVKNILLTVRSNHIPGCVASINIYRIEGKKESFVNVLHKLEPGKYFIAFQIVGCNNEALQAFLAKTQEEQEFWEMSIDFNIYLKSSYVREVAMGEMEHLPVNIGVAVKGLEYR